MAKPYFTAASNFTNPNGFISLKKHYNRDVLVRDSNQYIKMKSLLMQGWNQLTLMKSKPLAWMKLNPPTRRRAGFHPRRGFHHRRWFNPPDRVDLAENPVDKSRRYFHGRGWGIRTPANGVRVRCATVTLILCVKHGFYYTHSFKKVKHYFYKF